MDADSERGNPPHLDLSQENRDNNTNVLSSSVVPKHMESNTPSISGRSRGPPPGFTLAQRGAHPVPTSDTTPDNIYPSGSRRTVPDLRALSQASRRSLDHQVTLSVPESISDYTPDHWVELERYQADIHYYLGAYIFGPKTMRNSNEEPSLRYLFTEAEHIAYIQWYYRKFSPADMARHKTNPPVMFPRVMEHHEIMILRSGEYPKKQNCGHKRHPADDKTSGARYCPPCLIEFGIEYVLAIEERWKIIPYRRLGWEDMNYAWHFARTELANATRTAEKLSDLLEKDYSGEVDQDCHSWTKAAEIGRNGLHVPKPQPPRFDPIMAIITDVFDQFGMEDSNVEVVESEPEQWDNSTNKKPALVLEVPPKDRDRTLVQETSSMAGEGQPAIQELEAHSSHGEDLISTPKAPTKKKRISFSPDTQIIEKASARPHGYFNRTKSFYKPGKHAAGPGRALENTSNQHTPDYFLRHCKLFITDSLENDPLPKSTNDPRYVGVLGQWEYCDELFGSLRELKRKAPAIPDRLIDGVVIELRKEVPESTETQEKTGDGQEQEPITRNDAGQADTAPATTPEGPQSQSHEREATESKKSVIRGLRILQLEEHVETVWDVRENWTVGQQMPRTRRGWMKF